MKERKVGTILRAADEASKKKNLRLLVLNAVVLPPIIVGVALASARTETSDAIFYGIFIYSGFAVWSLSSRILQASDPKPEGLFLISVQFVFAFLLTVLWATLLLYVVGLKSSGDFPKALTFALGAIFIFIVFGSVFSTVWEGSLSDKWLQQSAKYAVLAVIICTVLAGLPQTLADPKVDQTTHIRDVLKPVLVFLFTIVAILAPVLFSSRSVSAHILIRVEPGKTESVVEDLAARDITATVTYGEYDVLAKVEVPGSFRWRFSRDDRGSLELAELADRVNSLGSISGIVETQTLLDFSGFVRPRWNNT